MSYRMDYVPEFDLHKDIALIAYMFCAKTFFSFFKGWYEKTLKSEDVQGNIGQRYKNQSYHSENR